MALLFTGTKTRSIGITHSVLRLSKFINLKPAKSITIKFDPFHESAESLRQVSYHINAKNIVLTNPKCRIRTEVISTQFEDPRIEVKLENGESILMQCHHLNVAEVFQLLIDHVSSLVPRPAPTPTNKLSGKQNKKK